MKISFPLTLMIQTQTTLSFFGYGQQGKGPPPPPPPPPPNGNLNQFQADLANLDWAPQPNANAAQDNLQIQNQLPAQQVQNEAPVLDPFLMVDQFGNAVPAPEVVAMPKEEVIQVLPNEAPLPDLSGEQVRAMDADTDTDSKPLLQVQLPIPMVDIVPFPNFANLQPVIPLLEDMIHEEDLLGWINAKGHLCNCPYYGYQLLICPHF